MEVFFFNQKNQLLPKTLENHMKNFIKDFWENQAEAFKSSHSASWGDHFAIALETENIANHINKDNLVLDVGCSNGHATLSMLEKEPAKIYGVDFSEKM